MRVGSRYLHYMLCDLLNKSASPEIGKSRILKEPEVVLSTIRNNWENNRIPKLHEIGPFSLSNFLIDEGDYKAIFIVRSHRDRLISLAFHHKHSKNYVHSSMTDEEAIQHTLESNEFLNSVANTHETMHGLDSLFNISNQNDKMFWVSYTKLLNEPEESLKRISDLIGYKPLYRQISKVVTDNSFEKKSGRKRGEEVRSDTWRRKGVEGDWRNHLSLEQVKMTEEMSEKYLLLSQKEQKTA